jgi:hypothetical protein
MNHLIRLSADENSLRASTAGLAALAAVQIFDADPALSEEVPLLEGKVRVQLPESWARDKSDSKGSLASFAAKKGDAWGSVVRGSKGLQPEGLDAFAKAKVAEYTKGLSWLPNLTWLKKDVVTIDGRKWADLRFIGKKERAKDPLDGLLYTRILETSYDGQLLEFTFSSNTDPNRATKLAIDQIVESVKVTE